MSENVTGIRGFANLRRYRHAPLHVVEQPVDTMMRRMRQPDHFRVYSGEVRIGTVHRMS